MDQKEHVPSTVLVVDDNPLLRMDAADILAQRGFVTLEAKNAAEALSILASLVEVQVLFTDVNMPPGQDGIDLVHEVRQRWPNVLLIVTSGEKANGRRSLPDDGRFIGKPYAAADLVGQIEDMLGKAAGS